MTCRILLDPWLWCCVRRNAIKLHLTGESIAVQQNFWCCYTYYKYLLWIITAPNVSQRVQLLRLMAVKFAIHKTRCRMATSKTIFRKFFVRVLGRTYNIWLPVLRGLTYAHSVACSPPNISQSFTHSSLLCAPLSSDPFHLCWWRTINHTLKHHHRIWGLNNQHPRQRASSVE